MPVGAPHEGLYRGDLDGERGVWFGAGDDAAGWYAEGGETFDGL